MNYNNLILELYIKLYVLIFYCVFYKLKSWVEIILLGIEVY